VTAFLTSGIIGANEGRGSNQGHTRRRVDAGWTDDGTL